MEHELNMALERERFCSRLATIPGVRPLPSIGGWILLQVEEPVDLARKLNRRLAPGMVSVPRHVNGAVRIPVREPKDNEILFDTVRRVMQVKHARVMVEDGAVEPF